MREDRPDLHVIVLSIFSSNATVTNEEQKLSNLRGFSDAANRFYAQSHVLSRKLTYSHSCSHLYTHALAHGQTHRAVATFLFFVQFDH